MNEIDGQFSPLFIWMSLLTSISIHVFNRHFFRYSALLHFWVCFLQRHFIMICSFIFTTHVYHFLSRILVNQTNQCCCVPSFKQQREQDLGVNSHFISMNISVLHSCCLWSKNTSHSLQITAMRSYQVINLITKWNPVRGSASLLVIWSALFLWSLPQWEMIGQTVKKSIEVSLPSCLLRFSMQDVAC